MNIEGAVKLGYRKELMAIEDPEARLAEFQRLTATATTGPRRSTPRPEAGSTT
jgi:acetyl-CoA carboxylase carboxyltransferase component